MRKFVLLALFLTLANYSSAAETPMYLLNKTALAANKARLAAGDENLRPALGKLLKEADAALKSGPFSVMDKKLVPPSGDKHDYMSLGPYWWPNPQKPDGKPYIRRDGEVNPESRTSDTDRPTLEKMKEAVETLALAYYFSGNEKYAAHAAKLLRVWFLDEATKMNPHLEYGQAIPGVSSGRGIGIIDTRNLPEMLDYVALLDTSPLWNQTDRDGLKQWFSAYLDWLLTSKNGKDEADEHNNHGTWYDVQVAGIALFVGKPEIAKEAVERAKTRLVKHIEPNGKQPHELARTKGFAYSTMNLVGFFHLADFGKAVGIDLWNFKSEDGRSLRVALNYLAPFADAQNKWPHPQIGGAEYQLTLLPLLKRGAL
ncbi:MAG TPA: alginate lyase family protein, partial [Abditibacteriaceae bacterium]